MSFIIKKQYPKAVVVRPLLMIVGAVFLLLVIVLIFYNLFHSMREIRNTNTQKIPHAQNYASTNDTKWFEATPLLPQTVPTSQQNLYPQPPTNTNHSITTSPHPLVPSSSASSTPQPQQPLTSPITNNQLVGDQFYKSNMNMNAAPSMSNASSSTPDEDPGQQGEKKAFLKNTFSSPDYLPATVNNPISPFELKAGTEIPALLIKGIDSDLPGQMRAQVRANVYDTASGRYILIPQGSTLTGIYDSQVSYGQQRVLVVWQRVIFPNGQSIDLQGMPGSDLNGYSGFKDKVDNHYIKIFSSVIIMSGLAAGAQLAQPQQSNNPFAAPTVGQTLAQSLGTNIANTGTTITAKNLNIPPTLKIRQGYKFNVDVSKDIAFPSPYRGG